MELAKKRNLTIVSLIILVNMLGYGIIIPLIYGYSQRFGLTDFQNGLLFASFSLCQFLATPIIGRLSDQYGRKPLLTISIFGTVVSFFLMAFAKNAAFLFLARILDGLTAGNIPVAYAVVSDSTAPQDRTKSFAALGSAFSFGFVFGPAIAALTVPYGQSVPFFIAAIITLIAALATLLYLPETNLQKGTVKKGKFIDIPLLVRTLSAPRIGTLFLISLLFFLAFSCSIIYGFQPYTTHILRLTQTQNAYVFTLFGVIGLLSQSFLVERIASAFGMRKTFIGAMTGITAAFFIMFLSYHILIFLFATTLLAVSNSVAQTLLPTLLSLEADEKMQGAVMGLNTSYQSIGMIAGPIIGGAVATIGYTAPFLLGTFIIGFCLFIALRIVGGEKEVLVSDSTVV